jgi:glycosyltransferase involved in cell wall biosynthesis
MYACDYINDLPDYQVDWFLEEDEPPIGKYDWIIPWGVSSIPFNNTIEKYKCKKALFCAGHHDDTANLKKFDVVFVESPRILKHLRPHCHRCILAFGVNCDEFQPLDVPKMIDAVYPATFSGWKRQQLFAEALKHQGLCFGVMQPDGIPYYQHCVRSGTMTLAGLMPQQLMRFMYNVSRTCVITSWHGSERTALEALACNLPVVVTNDNQLTSSLLPEEGAIACSPEPKDIREAFEKALTFKNLKNREYVLDKWTHIHYAKNILKGLNGE